MSDAQPTLDQRRARHAWQAVERARTLRDAQDFAREVKRLPVRIRTSGLGQSLAFLYAKSKSDGDARARLLSELGTWMLQERRLASSAKSGDKRALMSAIIAGDADLLRRASDEALLYLQWLTRFSEAEIDVDED